MSHFEFCFNDLRYGELKVIEHCEFSVNSGEIVTLLGPSGCGKTTLLNAISGINPTHGSGNKIDGNIGYIFQDARLIPWLTVQQNLRLIRPQMSVAEIDDILSSVQLTNTSHLYPNQLSGGMQKRVSIARAFLCKSELILLDEPFSSLDQSTAQSLRALVKQKITEKNIASILVTHDLDEALLLSSKIFILSKKPTSTIQSFDIHHSKNTDLNLLKQEITKKINS